MSKIISSPDAATGKTTAIEIKNIKIFQPTIVNEQIDMKSGSIISFLDKSIYVQDVDDTQNMTLMIS